MTNEERKVLAERLRADPALDNWHDAICSQAADQIEADGKRIAELEAHNEHRLDTITALLLKIEEMIEFNGEALGEKK